MNWSLGCPSRYSFTVPLAQVAATCSHAFDGNVVALVFAPCHCVPLPASTVNCREVAARKPSR